MPRLVGEQTMRSKRVMWFMVRRQMTVYRSLFARSCFHAMYWGATPNDEKMRGGVFYVSVAARHIQIYIKRVDLRICVFVSNDNHINVMIRNTSRTETYHVTWQQACRSFLRLVAIDVDVRNLIEAT